METEKAPNSQINLEKRKTELRNHAYLFQTTLQGYSNQNSMMLVQK